MEQTDLFGANDARQRLATELKAAKREEAEATRRMTRAGAPRTSRKAAEVVAGKKPTIRARVEQYARDRGARGFTDAELRMAVGTTGPESSFRKRRTELAQDGVVLDTGRERPNEHGVKATVWVHKDHAGKGAKRVRPAPSKVGVLEAEVERLRGALQGLEQAEATYRRTYESRGGGASETGRAWDLMRRAGNAARDILKGD